MTPIDRNTAPTLVEDEERVETMGERFTLPVLPLRDTVVYPGVAVPISAGRPGTVEAVQEALDGDRRLFAVAQRENVDDPQPEYLYNVGTIVRIIQTHRVRGGVQLLVQGESRAQALSYRSEGESMLDAVLLEMDRQEPRDPSTRRSRRSTASCATGPPSSARVAGAGRSPQPAHPRGRRPGSVRRPGRLLPRARDPDKQRLLETLDDEERMRQCLVAVERELARIDAQEDIQAKVQSELGERQREMLLREQLKAIQKELGEEEERDDVEEMRQRIEELELGEEQRSEVDRELRRLERTSPQSAEYQVIRTFLEWVTELPWQERRGEDRPRAGEEIMEEDHHGLEDVKDRVLEFLAVRKLISSGRRTGSVRRTRDERTRRGDEDVGTRTSGR
jgi:ATP-dependent Lon protease